MNNTSTYSVQCVKLGRTYCYLLKCNDGYLLIDVYSSRYYAMFEKKLARIGIAVPEIKYLLLTHHHDDHAGFAAELVRTAGCKIIAHRNALPALENGDCEGIGKPVNWCVRITMALYALCYELYHKYFPFPPVRLGERDIIIAGDDDVFLKGIGIDGIILHTPGHTGRRDSISVLLSDGSAFVGDAAMNFQRWTGSGHRPIYHEDINAIYESWKKLKEHGAKIIYPSHGKSFPAAKLYKSSGLAILI